MATHRYYFRCYARKEKDGTWFAMCLGLNLYARADTETQARDKLHGVVLDYVQDALGEDAAYKEDLIPRRAPLSFWAEYCWIWAIVHLRRARSVFQKAAGEARSVLFSEDLPMHSAR